ncbi:MAG TPA: hypothetical protein VFE60_17830 [Roseiarcus sp.]|jgi:hypothetical protein|nr:hypothetical protein [Roseiarcus sp.]
MARTNLTQVENEMRVLAEERIKTLVGDTPMLSIAQTARIWGKSSSWVKAMQAAGRVRVVQFGVRERVPRAVAIIGLVKGV